MSRHVFSQHRSSLGALESRLGFTCNLDEAPFTVPAPNVLAITRTAGALDRGNGITELSCSRPPV
jgi:hypothetical protein